MTLTIRCVAIAAALFAAPVAIAQTAAESAPVPAPATAPELKAGALLLSSDGKRIGRIERVVKGSDGAAVSAAVIVDSRFVYVPASTISSVERGFSTSLTRVEVRKLK